VKSPVAVSFTISDAAPAGSVQLSFGTNVLTLAASQATLGTHSFTFNPANPTASAEIASGGAIPDGIYAVTLSYLDTAGAVLASTSATDVLIDTTAPALTLPAPITAEATSVAGAVVDFTASALDIGSGIATSSFTPASGSTFALGTTTVNAPAADHAGNTVTGSFTVTVQDTTAPVITPPADIGGPATSEAGSVVTFSAPSISDAVGVTEVTTPTPAAAPSRSAPPRVTIRATDAANNSSTATFNVSVLSLAFTLPARERHPQGDGCGREVRGLHRWLHHGGYAFHQRRFTGRCRALYHSHRQEMVPRPLPSACCQATTRSSPPPPLAPAR